MKTKILILLIVTFICQYANAIELPSPQGYVSDFAGVLRREDKHSIISFASELEEKTKAQIAVVTIGSIRPYEIEDYAVRLFEQWGIGRKGLDDGVLILLAVNDKKVRIEVGYGLEGVIPDAIANSVIQDTMIPYFKKGDYSRGILSGSLEVMSLISKEHGVALKGFKNVYTDVVPQKPSFFANLLNFLFTLFILFLFMSLRMGLLGWFLFLGTGRRRGGYWFGSGYGGNGGGFSGGFGGFGGGLSGGGGASGSW